MTGEKPPKAYFEAFLRKTFQPPLDWLGARLLKIGLTPNHITIMGLAGNIGAVILIAVGELRWGGLVAALMAPLDAVDGAMARLRGKPSRFGAFFDSVLDRYADAAVYSGIIISGFCDRPL